MVIVCLLIKRIVEKKVGLEEIRSLTCLPARIRRQNVQIRNCFFFLLPRLFIMFTKILPLVGKSYFGTIKKLAAFLSLHAYLCLCLRMLMSPDFNMSSYSLENKLSVYSLIPLQPCSIFPKPGTL